MAVQFHAQLQSSPVITGGIKMRILHACIPDRKSITFPHNIEKASIVMGWARVAKYPHQNKPSHCEFE